MVNEVGSDEPLVKLKGLKSDISILRSKLNELNDKKEDCFKKKQELQNQISDLVSMVKKIKSDKDSSSKALFDERGLRDKYNSEVKSLVDEAKRLNKERKDFLDKHHFKFDPARLSEKIHHLESSIETEAYTFEKEKKVMAEIKKLKKMYSEVSALDIIVKRNREISKKIDEAKLKADEAHLKFKGLVDGNKEGYKGFIDVSRRINDLKKERDLVHTEFLEFKKQFVSANSELKQKLVELKDIQSKVSKIKEEKLVDAKNREELTLMEKARGVEEKIRKGKKLTTEDLIVFQGASKD